jgi:hypothetical protein
VPRKTKTNQTQNQQTERNTKDQAEINEIKTKQSIQRNNKTKSWFFKKIKKIDKPFANMTICRKVKTQINKIKDEKGDITPNTNEIQKIIREYFENLYSSKLENLDKME